MKKFGVRSSELGGKSVRAFFLVFLFSAFVSELITPHSELAYAVEVQPARLELTISADGPTQGSIEVTNHSPKAVKVQIQTGPYRFLGEELPIPSAQGWFSFDPESFTIGPGVTSEVTFRVSPPANLLQDAAGEYLAAILVDELPAESASPDQEEGAPAMTGKITVVPRYALPAYLIIQGRERIKVEWVDLSVKPGQPPWEQGVSPLLRIEAALKNSGSVHVRPTGTVTIVHGQGSLYQTIPLGKSLPLLPGGTLKMPALLPLPPPGEYRAIVTLELSPGQTLQKEIAFVVTPEKEIR